MLLLRVCSTLIVSFPQKADMDIFEEIEFESEAYTSLWLTQNTLKKGNKIDNVANTNNIDLTTVLGKPHLFIFRHPNEAVTMKDFDFLANCSHKGRRITTKKDPIYRLNTISEPFALVVILSPCRTRNRCRLSTNDLTLLANIRNIKQIENSIYIVRDLESSLLKKFDVGDLDVLSTEIQEKMYDKMECNNIFNKLFPISDLQILIRIGHCLHHSILCNIRKIYDNIQNDLDAVYNELKRLDSDRNYHISFLPEKISARIPAKVRKCSFIKLKQDVVDASIAYFASIVEGYDHISCRIDQENTHCLLCQPLENRLDKILDKTDLERKKESPNRKVTSTRDAKTSSFSGLSLCQDAKQMEEIWSKIAAGLFDEFSHVLTNYLQTKNDNLSNQSKSLEDELKRGNDMIILHEWKMVAERHNRVKGFGYVDSKIHIYLKEDSKGDKVDVELFLKRYIPQEKWKHPLKIEFRQRKITLYSKIEQGSKINKTNGSDGDGIKYGTLGLFLEDKNGEYFFTTCAHVIGEKEMAYSPHDNSILGKSVLVYDSNTIGNAADQKGVRMDFSLIKVLPERDLTCQFGLKTINSHFIPLQIFRGDISEVYQRTVYRWAANKPDLQLGRYIGFESDRDENGYFHCLQIDNNDFAKPGDSGAIICIGEDTETGIAAFVLVGGTTDENTGRHTYLVYKISDALEKAAMTGNDFKPCIRNDKICITISTTASGQSENPKRKRGDKVLPPRSVKRLSPNKQD